MIAFALTVLVIVLMLVATITSIILEPREKRNIVFEKLGIRAPTNDVSHVSSINQTYVDMSMHVRLRMSEMEPSITKWRNVSDAWKFLMDYAASKNPKIVFYRNTSQKIIYSVVMRIDALHNGLLDVIEATIKNADIETEFVFSTDGKEIEQTLVNYLQHLTVDAIVVALDGAFTETAAENMLFRLASGTMLVVVPQDTKITTKNYHKAMCVPLVTYNDIFMCSSECAQTLDGYIKIGRSKSTGKFEPDPNNNQEQFYIAESCTRGPIAFEAAKMETIGYLDEVKFISGDDDLHDANLRAYKRYGWRACYIPTKITKLKIAQKGTSFTSTHLDKTDYMHVLTRRPLNGPLDRICDLPMINVVFANTQSAFYSGLELAAIQNVAPIVAYTEHDIAKFISKNNINTKNRGFGYWAWKPYIIMDAMCKAKEGAVIVYTDSGYCLDNPGLLRRMVAFMDDMVLFENVHNIYQYTRKHVLGGMDPEYAKTTPMVDAAVFILRNNKNTQKLVSRWLDLCTQIDMIRDAKTDEEEHGDFIEHRHDQSLLSKAVYEQCPEYIYYSQKQKGNLGIHHRIRSRLVAHMALLTGRFIRNEK